MYYQAGNNEFPTSLSVLFGEYLPPDFSSTQKEGYEFVYERSVGGDSFKCVARPLQKGVTGNKSFLITDAGEVTEIK